MLIKEDARSSQTTKTFNARTYMPASTNPYYLTRDNGGYNPSIHIQKGSVLPNCVGYAWGRFNEIQGNTVSNWKQVGGNANQVLMNAYNAGWPVSTKPCLGAIAVFDMGAYGHVAVVEDYASETEIWVSDSSYGAEIGSTGTPFGGYFHFGFGKINPKQYSILGYIINPAIAGGDYEINRDWLLYEANQTYGGAYAEIDYDNRVWPSLKNKQSVKNSVVFQNIRHVEQPHTITYDEIKQLTQNSTSRGKNILSYPALVETPFVILQVGEYTFGSVNAEKLGNNKLKVSYPNYMKSLRVVKVNGTVNQYTINLEYQIRSGDDPNLLEKVFSSVGYGKVYISYGDWATPTYLYKNEEAIITKVTSNVDFANSKISYTVYCTSNAVSLMGGNLDFPARVARPSDVIKELLKNDTNGLRTKIFTGMNNSNMGQLVPGDDKQVEISPKTNIDILAYLEYLVSCMTPSTTNAGATIKDATYYLTIHDAVQTDQEFLIDDINEINNADTKTIVYKSTDGTTKRDVYNLVKSESYTKSINGPYFKITKVNSNLNVVETSTATYEIDVGFPGEPGSSQQNLVLDFKLNSDNSWSLLYDYSKENVNLKDNYIYTINDNGELTTSIVNRIAVTNKYKSSPSQNDWWTKMTQFPVSATITIKGLVRPAILMSYIRINALFYGQKHVSSGLYIITRQEDSIDSKGYRTTLSLTRIAGDKDYIERTTKTVWS